MESKMKFRVAKRGDEFYPQVKFWWSKWFRIGKHNFGFGLYPHDDYSYPKLYLIDALDVIEAFKKSRNVQEKVEYLYFD